MAVIGVSKNKAPVLFLDCNIVLILAQHCILFAIA